MFIYLFMLLVIRNLVIGWREKAQISATIVARVDIHHPKDADRGRRDSPDATGRFENMQRWGGRGEEITLTCGQRESSRVPRGFQQVSKPYSRFSPKTIVVCEIRSIPTLGVLGRVTNLAPIRLADAAMRKVNAAASAKGVRDRVCPHAVVNK